MKIKQATLQFVTGIRYPLRAAEHLRGCLANKYREENEFHNHTPDGSSIFRMPGIQYKIINGILTIVAYNENIPILADKFLKIKALQLKEKQITNFETRFTTGEQQFEITDILQVYRFITPWLALNQKNHNLYLKQGLDLDRVLRNNILTNFKGFGITADKRIMVKGHYREQKVRFKDMLLTGFKGQFVCNIKMPDYMAVGKHRAIGYGCVMQETK